MRSDWQCRCSRRLTAAVVVAVMGMSAGRSLGANTPSAPPPPGDPVPAAAAEAIRPLLIGATVPGITLRTVDGRPYDLNAALAERPTVLIFYRGGWCPYCNVHLGALRTIESDLRGLGFQLLAISPDRPEVLNEAAEADEGYTRVSDAAMTAARAFGIAFRVDDATLEVYKGYGIDLEAASGERHHLLPVPAVFIVGTDGVIRFAYANPDYKVRLEPEVLLAAARAIALRAESQNGTK